MGIFKVIPLFERMTEGDFLGEIKMTKQMVPIYLTVLRMVFVIPIVWMISWGTEFGYFFSAILLGVAGLTDGLDGYLSRKWNAQTTVGALLDPAADKILTLSILIFLSYFQIIDPFLVMIFVARDIYVTSLRSIAANKGLILYAKPLAKWKTTVQLVGILLVLMGVAISVYMRIFGYGLLWVAVVMSILSAWDYTMDFRKKFKFVEFSS